MKIIHGIWSPDLKADFIQTGQFYIWVETDEVKPKKSKNLHPQQLREQDGLDFLKSVFAYQLTLHDPQPLLHSIYLPTVDDNPVPAPEFSTNEISDEASLQAWQVYAYPVISPLKTLGDIYFLTHYQLDDVRISSDFLFWYYFSQSFKQVLYKDQYIPAVVAEKIKTQVGLYRCWKIVSPTYEALIEQAVSSMPLACAQNYQPESLLRHFAEVSINQVLNASIQKLPQVFAKKVQADFLETILLEDQIEKPIKTLAQIPSEFQQWHQWQQKFLSVHQQSALQLGFQLYEADAEKIDDWQLSFLLCSHKDPSFKLNVADFWEDSKSYDELIAQQFGKGVEQQLLVNLAHAARIYPKLWLGMETNEPAHLVLTLEEAFEFLRESAWILEDAGFRVVIPAKLTPKERQRAKMRLRSSDNKQGGTEAAKSYLSLDSLTNYYYELAIGDEKVSVEEWQQLVDMKTPLVHFRGQWMELDREKMQEMLAFWQQQKNNPEQLSVHELLKKLAEESDSLEIDAEDSLAQMLARLNDSSHFDLIENPEKLNAELRDYQKRGVSWLRYLETLGLNGCLADDMGLGKTMQVIATLILEKEAGKIGPTLLIAPTSVIGTGKRKSKNLPRI